MKGRKGRKGAKSRKIRENRESRKSRRSRKSRKSRKRVPVTDLLKVQLFDGQGDLEEVQLSLSLVQLCLLDDLVKQLSALRQLQHDEQEFGRVNHILQVYDARMVHQLKDPYLVQHVGGAVTQSI